LFTNLKAGMGTMEAYSKIREHISHLEADRVLSQDINMMQHLVHEGKILNAVENKIGLLN